MNNKTRKNRKNGRYNRKSNMYLIKVLEEKTEWSEAKFVKIMAEKFPKLMKNINPQFQGAW